MISINAAIHHKPGEAQLAPYHWQTPIRSRQNTNVFPTRNFPPRESNSHIQMALNGVYYHFRVDVVRYLL